jgi:hypothetical protein
VVRKVGAITLWAWAAVWVLGAVGLGATSVVAYHDDGLSSDVTVGAIGLVCLLIGLVIARSGLRMWRPAVVDLDDGFYDEKLVVGSTADHEGHQDK